MAELYELSHDSPVYRLVAKLTEAVSRRTGRPSRWNGIIMVDPSPKAKDGVGFAYADGHMSISEPFIVDRLLLAYADEPVRAEDLDKVLNAAATLAHEVGHLDSRDGDAWDGHPVDDASAVALDEGLMEKWTWDELDDLLHETGLAERVPGLVGRGTLDEYPAYTAAVDQLLVELEPLTGLHPEELAAELRGTDRSQRWNRIAELAIGHELPGLPADRLPETRLALANSLRLRFSEAQAIQQDDSRTPEQKRTDGRRVGERTVRLLDAELERLSHQLSRDQPVQQATWAAPDPATVVAARPAPPGFATDTRNASSPSAPSAQSAPSAPSGESARTISSAEVEHLNGFLSGRSTEPRTAGPRPAGARPDSARSDGSRPDTARSGAGRAQTRASNGPGRSGRG